MTDATRWLVPDGWMPPHGDAEVDGHEAVCLLNTSDRDASVRLTFYFEDREPATVEGLACPARRTRHFRLDRPHEVGGYELPAETPYALVLESDVPVTVQHTRVDTRQTALSLMTTMAVPSEVVS
jgi:hypothetical protein